MLHYIEWPDFGVPNSPNTLFRMISTLKQWNPSRTVIHCSAGVGRTGTFIALSKLIDQVESNAEHLNIFQTVLDLREARRLMVN